MSYYSKAVYLNHIFYEDTIYGMKKLPSESFDVIISDPPYNIKKDFGENQDNLSLEDYIVWSQKWITEAIRLLRPHGTLYVYGFSEILAHISVNIPLEQRWLIWHYTNKTSPSSKFWQRSYEAIICAWKETPYFDRDAVREPYTENFIKNAAGKKRAGTKGRFSHRGATTTYTAHEKGALPRDVIDIPALAGGAGKNERWFICHTCNLIGEPSEYKKHREHEVEKHPTQKPQKLTERLLLASAPKYGDVLIPFVGTGSECFVAKKMGLSYTGFENNNLYIQLAEKLLESVK